MSAAPVIELTSRGLYVPRADVYIDPWEPVSRAIVTHAHSDHAHPGMDAYVCAAPGETVLRHRMLPDAQIETRAFGEVWHEGDATISLHPAGHLLGSAQVRVEVDGEVWVVSGDYKRAPDPSCEAFEVVPCHVFITEATFALPIYRWTPGHVVASEIRAWWERNAAAGRTSVLFGYSLGKSQRILAELARLTDRPVWIHGALHALTELYREAGIDMLPTQLVSETKRGHPFGGELVMAPPSAGGSTWMRRFGAYRTAFASGWCRVRGIRRRRNVDQGFVLSDHVDWPALLNTIRETGARRVLATHGRTDVLVRILREEGIEADALETAFTGDADED